MQLIHDFFVNMMIILALLFIYYQFFREENLAPTSSLKRKFLSGLYAGIIGVFLMIYSIQVDATTIVDLRHIPLLLVTLYGGPVPGVIALIVIQITRFIIGINLSSFVSLGLLTSLYIGYLIFREWKVGIFIKALWMLLYSNLVFSILIVYLLLDIKSLFSEINVLFWITSTVTGVMAIYTTEHLRKINHLFKEYKKSATIDPLTGLNNVRSFDDALNRAIQEATANDEKPLSLLVIDIDHFKKVNDTYGHASGDIVLTQFGKTLRSAARLNDIVSRNGGEEFTILLGDCTNREALEIGERVRSLIEENSFAINKDVSIHITASLGASTFPETVQSPAQLYREADEALYHAKRSGRNRICSNEQTMKVYEY
ncbi:diguanylate cyclase [Alkalihalobacillus hwajinpoensis]|uniref:diguanylate cyclase n=1 Tax=Guptibacillus hwajinpoensis TaxID=208199 RepID=UPI001883B1CD|nr:diguanylate cyclase [Pseudalkalibacillus hwajinpoensis]MBF0707257.1 diguanylate cyclase [Pseudalkalibacillus hwajinpoensis]